MESDSNTPSFFSEGLTIAAVSVFSYMLTFLYEYGYCGVMGIPVALISVDLTSAFVVVGLLFLLLSFVWIIAEWLHRIWPKAPSVYHRIMARYSVNISVLLFLIFLFGTRVSEYIVFAIIGLSLLAGDFLVPLIAHRDLKTYKEKLEAAESLEGQEFLLARKALSAMGSRGKVLIFGIFLMYISMNLGRGYAYKQNAFYVISGEPPLAILRIYGDRFVCARVNRSANEISEFEVISTNDLKGHTISLEAIGPLEKIKVKRHEEIENER